jgi:hypothetical protein
MNRKTLVFGIGLILTMTRKKHFLVACFFMFSSLFLFAGEERVITIETEPADCQVKIYEWAPREGNKGDIIVEGKSPLKFPEEILKNNRGIVITVSAKEEGYLSSEQSFFAPYSFSFNKVKVMLQKDYEYLARKAEQQRKEKERKRAEIERQRAEAIRIQAELKKNQAKADIGKEKYPTAVPFEILAPKKLIKQGGQTTELMKHNIEQFSEAMVKGMSGSTYRKKDFNPSEKDAYTERLGISFSVKNISSSIIKECFFKIIYAYEDAKEKIFMGEDIVSIKNLPPGYSTPMLQSWAKSIFTTQSPDVLYKSRLSEWQKYKIRLFWAQNYSGPWQEISNFSEHLELKLE